MNRLLMIAAGITLATASAATGQTFGPDYGQRGLPGGSDTVSGGGDLLGKDLGPVACVYQHTFRIPRPDAVDLVNSGFAAKTNKQKMAFQLVGEAVAACRAGTGWSPERQNAAIRFFSARVLTDDALYQARDLGLNAKVVKALDASLDPEAKAAFASGNVDGPHLAAAMGQLKAAGLDPAALTEEQRQALAPLMARALWGLYLQKNAVAAYKAG